MLMTQDPLSCKSEILYIAILTQLQFRVGFAQAPVHIAVTVSLFKQVVQNFPDILPFVDHQSLGAAVIQQHLHHQLSEKFYFVLL